VKSLTSMTGRRRGGGFVRRIIRFFVMVVIYDIIIGTIASVLGIPRMTALFIFLGGLIAISVAGYIIRTRASQRLD
jgi:hypothetical protein